MLYKNDSQEASKYFCLRLIGYPESIIDQTKHSQNHQKNPRPLNTEWSIFLRTSKLQNHKHFPKRGHSSTGRAQIIHSQTSSLSQQQRTDMHEGQLPYLRHQIVLITQCCLPNDMQQLQPTLHREHYKLYPRSCERTPEQ